MSDDASRDRSLTTTFQSLQGRNSVLFFFAATFTVSWAYWGLVGLVFGTSLSPFLTLPGLWGPPIAALLVLWLKSESVPAFLRRRLALDRGGQWYVVAFLGPIAIGSVPPLVQVLSGASYEVNLVRPVGSFVVALFAGGLEEIGLRGFAHPRLRTRYSLFWTGILIGLPWAVWHVPLHELGVGFEGSFLLFASAAVAISVLLGWLYEQTDGSVLPVIIAHAAFDMPDVLQPAASVSEDLEFASRLAGVGLLWLLVLAVALWEKDRQ